MNYHNITYPDMNNGDGLRVVLWLSGCDHHCNGCQNPQTWDVNSGIPFDKDAKEELFNELDKEYISGLTLTGGDPLYKANLSGVQDIVKEFHKRYVNTQYVMEEENGHIISCENSDERRISIPTKTIWIYTGYTWEQLFKEDNFGNQGSIYESQLRREIILSSDVLVDGPYIDKQRDVSLKWRGSLNQRVIDVKKSTQQCKVMLYCD